MAETIPGGAFLGADGKTWHDAEGRPLDAAQVSAAQEVLGLQAMEKAEAERIRALTEAASNPIAQALQQAIAPRKARKPAEE